jgi:hypothetical protein
MSGGKLSSHSLSLSEPTLIHQRNALPPNVMYPRVGWHPMTHRGHPQDHVQDCVRNEKI